MTAPDVHGPINGAVDIYGHVGGPLVGLWASVDMLEVPINGPMDTWGLSLMGLWTCLGYH